MISTSVVHEPVFPKAVVLSSEKEGYFDSLLQRKPLAVSFSPLGLVVLKAGGFVVLDFGEEYSGGIRLLSSHPLGKKMGVHLRVRFGESVGEALSEIGEKNSTNDHAPRDFEILLPAWADQPYGSSAFRYVRIDNIDEEDALFYAIVLDYTHSSAMKVASFQSDDVLLNQIFNISCKTAFLCLQNGYLYDAPKRDRLIWSGDLNVEIKTILDAYGDIAEIPSSLRFCVTSSPLPGWMNSIPSYSLWWVLNLGDYVLQSGDRPFLKENEPYLQGLLKQIDSCVSPSGELDFLSSAPNPAMAYFIDWGSYGSANQKAAVVSLLRLALLEMKTLLEKLQESTSEVDRLLSRLHPLPLEEEKRASVLALQYLAWGKEETGLLETTPAGLSTFTSYLVFKALAAFGAGGKALALLKEYYGAMLKEGATTFFEDYSPSWGEASPIAVLPREGIPAFPRDFGAACYEGYRMSLCHGWASGPVPFLLEEVVGVSFLDEKTVLLKPHLYSLKYVQASVMTSCGPLSIDITPEKVSYHAPKGLTVRLAS